MKKLLLVVYSFSFSLYTHNTLAQHRGSMTFTVNSLADDDDAHPWDDPDTKADESMDGVCEDMAHRCTLRAGLEEAAHLEKGAYALFDGGLSGNLVLDDNQGTLSPPDGSVLYGANQKVILYGGSSTSTLLVLGNNSRVFGLGFANGLIGLVIAGNDNYVGSHDPAFAQNYFHNFSQNGIIISGDNNFVQSNRIGIAYDNSPVGSPFGIFITGKNNTIGGINEGEGNIISGNDIGIGVYTIEGNTYIQGNKIGTDSTGTIAVGNRVGIDNIGPNLEIGKDEFVGGNVISGNAESGILMGVDAEQCYIIGNNIGVDPSGKIAVPNRDGITLGPGSNVNTIYRNKISFNDQNGVLISGIPDLDLEATYNLIEGNEIYANGLAGVAMVGAAYNNIVGSFINEFSEPNDIRFNGTAAVLLTPQFANPERNTIRRNIMQDNTILGIYIQAGQANIQPPVLSTYVDPGQGSVNVTGSHALAGAVIDFYEGDANQNGTYEGLTWKGESITDASGNFSASFPACNCDTIVATATDALGNTSEFTSGFGLMTATPSIDGFSREVLTYPNPFHNESKIQFNLLNSSDVMLSIYDINGREVDALLDDNLPAGTHQVIWKPERLSPGLYYYRFVVDSFTGASGKLAYFKN